MPSVQLVRNRSMAKPMNRGALPIYTLSYSIHLSYSHKSAPVSLLIHHSFNPAQLVLFTSRRRMYPVQLLPLLFLPFVLTLPT